MSEMLERRARRIAMPDIGFAKPAEELLSYVPFDDSRYSHRDRLFLPKEPWNSLTKLPTAELLSPDPFARSKYREGGFAVWDSAAIPQSEGSYQAGAIVDEVIRRMTFENTHFDEIESRMSGMVGTNEFGQPMRPVGPMMLDLTRMGAFGWMLAESAHALAHMRCDKDFEFESFRPVIQKAMCTALASLLHGILYDVPVYIGPNHQGHALAWPGTGFATADFKFPVMQVRKNGTGSLEPDEVCVECLYLFHVEPVPESFITKTDIRGVNDEWSGLPTIMAFAGWDGIDSLIHGRSKIQGRMEYHILHAGDLIEPKLFAEAIQNTDIPKPEGPDWVDVRKWIGSKEWLDLVSETPPLPCRDCYMINRSTPGAPVKREFGKMKDMFDKLRDECIAITETRASRFELGCYVSAQIKRPKREDRIRKNAKRRKALKRAASEADRIRVIKRKVSGEFKSPLTEHQRKIYEEMKKKGIA